MINGFCKKKKSIAKIIVVNSVIEYLQFYVLNYMGSCFLITILTVLVIKEDGKIVIFVK